MIQMVVVENRTLGYKASDASGRVVESNVSNYHRSCTFEREGTRFEIVVTSLENHKYVVAITNFYFSIETRNPIHIGYKLAEKLELSKVDRESVELAIEWLMSR